MDNFLSGSGILSLTLICPFLFIVTTIGLFASCETVFLGGPLAQHNNAVDVIKQPCRHPAVHIIILFCCRL